MCVSTHSHGGAVFANTSIQNDVEVVVAGVEGPPDDAHDGEAVQLQSNDGQLRKHTEVKLRWRHKGILFIDRRQVLIGKAAGMPSVMGGQSKKNKSIN